jgi:hypothetical protein
MRPIWNVFSCVLHEIRFDYLPSSPLENGWIKVSDTDAIPNFHKAAQFRGGLLMQTGGRVFAMDYYIPVKAKSANGVKFKAEFRQEAKFYTELDVLKTAGSLETENWWFQHVKGDKNQAPVKDPKNREWVFYIQPTDGQAQFDIDVVSEAAQVLQGKSFDRIKTVRLRGDICLSPIQIIRKRVGAARFSLGERLGLIGLAATVIGIIISLFVPEVRLRLGIDKPSIQMAIPNPAKPSDSGPKSLSAEFASGVEEMRQRHHVDLIPQVESEKTTLEVPTDSFGFVNPSSVTLGHPMPIYYAGSKGTFEIHKLHDGSLVILGFVGPESFIHLREGVKNGEPITIHSTAFDQATKLFAFPLTRIECYRHRDLGAVSALDCKVRD